MKTIRALQNCGHGGENIAKGSVIKVDPDDFGGTYADFIAGGFFEEGHIGPLKNADGSPVVNEKGEPVTGFIAGAAPVADVPAEIPSAEPPKGKKAAVEAPSEPPVVQ